MCTNRIHQPGLEPKVGISIGGSALIFWVLSSGGASSQPKKFIRQAVQLYTIYILIDVQIWMGVQILKQRVTHN